MNERPGPNLTQAERSAENPVAPRWQEILLNPDVTSEAYGRLSGVLNILKNGAQTLTVLTMVDDIHSFNTVGNIKRGVDEKAGGKVVKGNNVVKEHLASCIEPVGAAARSTLDNDMWALTRRGIKMKAPLVFAWSKFLNLGINPMDVLGTTSHSKADDQGNITSTPAVARATILTALRQYGELNRERLSEILSLNSNAVSIHLTKLRDAGLINFESVDVSGGKAATHFTLIDKAKEHEGAWPVYVDSRGVNRMLYTDLTKNALAELSAAGQEITAVNICQIILNKKPKYNRRGLLGNISSVLSFWVREGLLKRGKFKEHYYSEALLTDKGHLVVDEIIEPLAIWSIDKTLTGTPEVKTAPTSKVAEIATTPEVKSASTSGVKTDPTPEVKSASTSGVSEVGEIANITQTLKVNHDAYQGIYPDIVQSFKKTSPYVNQNKDETTDKILATIRQNQGQLTAADVARMTGISPSRVLQLVTELRSQGYVTGNPINKQRILLSVGTINHRPQNLYTHLTRVCNSR